MHIKAEGMTQFDIFPCLLYYEESLGSSYYEESLVSSNLNSNLPKFHVLVLMHNMNLLRKDRIVFN